MSCWPSSTCLSRLVQYARIRLIICFSTLLTHYVLRRSLSVSLPAEMISGGSGNAERCRDSLVIIYLCGSGRGASEWHHKESPLFFHSGFLARSAERLASSRVDLAPITRERRGCISGTDLWGSRRPHTSNRTTRKFLSWLNFCRKYFQNYKL